MKSINLILLSVLLIGFGTACTEKESVVSMAENPTDSTQDESSEISDDLKSDSNDESLPQVFIGTALMAGDVGQTLDGWPLKLTITKNSDGSLTEVYEETYNGEITVSTCTRTIEPLENDLRYIEVFCGAGHSQYSVCYGDVCNGHFTNAGIGDPNELFAFSEVIEEDKIMIHFNLYEGEVAWGLPDVYAIVYDLTKQ